VNYLVSVLVDHDRAHVAEQWLSAALVTAARNAGRYVPGSDATLGDLQNIADTISIIRLSVRRDDLGLSPDGADHSAAKVRAVLDREADLQFWPEAAFTELLAASPQIADDLGASWDDHRTMIERALKDAHDESEDLVVEVGTPAQLTAALGARPTFSPAGCWTGRRR
jgi:hypothetical protein